MITYYLLLSVRSHDLTHTEALLENFHDGLVPADKAFIDPVRPSLLRDRYGITLLVPPRVNMTQTLPNPLLKASRKWRKVVETVGSQLTELFDIASTRSQDLWHYQNKIIPKILAHTSAVFINFLLHRPSLDLDGLLLF